MAGEKGMSFVFVALLMAGVWVGISYEGDKKDKKIFLLQKRQSQDSALIAKEDSLIELDILRNRFNHEHINYLINQLNK